MDPRRNGEWKQLQKRALWQIPLAIGICVVAWVTPGQIGALFRFLAGMVLVVVMLVLLVVSYRAHQVSKKG